MRRVTGGLARGISRRRGSNQPATPVKRPWTSKPHTSRVITKAQPRGLFQDRTRRALFRLRTAQDALGGAGR